MTDTITVTGLRAHGFHGVLASEREAGQDFVVDLELRVDLAAAGNTDSLTNTVDYAAVSKKVVAIIESEPVDLIETLANQIADSLLEFARVESVRVTVHKPQAPIAATFSDVAVSIERSRT